MLVPVTLVVGMPVPVMDVVEVILMWDADVTAALAVLVSVFGVSGVLGRLTVIVMIAVKPVEMAVVSEIHVVAVRQGHVTAALAMLVLVDGMVVRGLKRAHRGGPPGYG